VITALALAQEGAKPAIVAAENEAAKWVKPDNPTAGVKCLEQMKLACGHKELEGLQCMKCVNAAKDPALGSSGISTTACVHTQFKTFCFASENTDKFYTNSKVIQEALPAAPSPTIGAVAKVATAAMSGGGVGTSDACVQELKYSMCDMDKMKGGLTKCLSCVEAHKKKINSGLVEGDKCTAVELASFCDPLARNTDGLNSRSATEELEAGSLKESMQQANGDIDDDTAKAAVAEAAVDTTPPKDNASRGAHSKLSSKDMSSHSMVLAACKVVVAACDVDHSATSKCIACAESHVGEGTCTRATM
jgi:hypothetical protein